ncbi:MAG: hypothetical protein GYB65_00255 [Chloroflexi bacterium]|nr:hypothetical protein [Chloroflexota bacterium]
MYFDLVINCDLREDTPAEAIEAVRCLTCRDCAVPANPQLVNPYDPDHNVWELFADVHFLASLPGQEVVSNFQRRTRMPLEEENNREGQRYVLQYAGRMIHDDFFYQHHLPFLYWLASVSHDSHLGYYKVSQDREGNSFHLFVVTDGKIEKIKR